MQRFCRRFADSAKAGWENNPLQLMTEAAPPAANPFRKRRLWMACSGLPQVEP